MNKKIKILAIVPAYNEADSIVGVIKDINTAAEGVDILIVDDGSKDNTKALALSTGMAEVISLVANLGIGGAVQTGFKYAQRHGYDIAIQFDGDGQHIADQISVITSPIQKGEADMVIGSRFVKKHDGWKSSLARRIGIYTFTMLNAVLIGKRITDSTSGFRAYSKEAIEFLSDYYPQDYPEPETVILLGRNGFGIQEKFTIMQERTGGKSSISFVGGIYYMMKVMLAMMITALRAPSREVGK